jgi:hypothetical protein
VQQCQLLQHLQQWHEWGIEKPISMTGPMGGGTRSSCHAAAVARNFRMGACPMRTGMHAESTIMTTTALRPSNVTRNIFSRAEGATGGARSYN